MPALSPSQPFGPYVGNYVLTHAPATSSSLFPNVGLAAGRAEQLRFLWKCSPPFQAGRCGPCTFWWINCINDKSQIVTMDDKFGPFWTVCKGNHEGRKLLSIWPIHWLFITVTQCCTLLNGADKPCLAVTIKPDGPVLTYIILEPVHRAALNFKKQILEQFRRQRHSWNTWICCSCAGPTHPKEWSLLLWDVLN